MSIPVDHHTELPAEYPSDPIRDELRAMGELVGALGPLDEPARRRVLQWVAAVFEIELQPYPPIADPIDEAAIVAMGAAWASAVVLELQAEEIEQTVLERQSWGDEVGLIEGALPEVAKRIRIMGGLGVGDGD